MHQERCARKAAWDLANNIYKLKNSDKTMFYVPGEVKAMPAPTSKRPEEREFVVDSGASMHMMSKKELSSQEMRTVQLLEETPAVLSLGKVCKDHGYSCEWVSGQKLRLTKDGKSIVCKTDKFVPLVVRGLSVNSGSSSSSTSLPQESLSTEANQASGNRAASSSSSGSVCE